VFQKLDVAVDCDFGDDKAAPLIAVILLFADVVV
jgi:hypothetical protein